ncbi:hypothetical protein FRB94_009013 [Tulasnella sp. JGI-2019a]|nr:hypothetical protein FRB93_003458 [Tulasnella sp. JGI-2019a]KAG9014855.1 hypothetical protein FRB94_009013 [Tulasnella sp. JGI-2019a]KAG9039984.1 hypothetical protein FRB95_004456 [Tulasnella sp. JGI-2019a]
MDVQRAATGYWHPVTFTNNDKHTNVQGWSRLCAAAQEFKGHDDVFQDGNPLKNKEFIYAFYHNTNGRIGYALYDGQRWDGKESSIGM